MGPSASGRVLLRGGTIIAGGDVPLQQADILVEDGTIVAIGQDVSAQGSRIIDCAGRFIMPGFIDAHSHADGLLRDESVQRALLRQGVTTVIVGQDGVSYAPGDGTYGNEYFGALNGPYPAYTGGGIAGYLSSIDGASRVNAAALVPAGTVRSVVCGRAQGSADSRQRDAMSALVEEGMRDGAVGLSTGLDYVPGIFQDADEIAALCVPVARAHGVYVSHMRGGYENNTAVGIDEIIDIVRRVDAMTGLPLAAHVSHFHADADIVLDQLNLLDRADVDVTFDAYPYIRGCSLLSMPLLPASLAVQAVDDVVGVLSDPESRERLRTEWFPTVERHASLGPGWPSMMTFAHIDAPAFTWALGLTIEEAAARSGSTPIDLALDVLVASRLRATTVMAVANPRPASELARIFAHPAHMAGSDGIFVGGHPHPRARGTFARYLREYVRERATWTWNDAVAHLSGAAAQRFGLGRRGRVAEGAVADLIVVDLDDVSDTATYAEPLQNSVGIDDVLVAGVPVLAGGELLDAKPGRGIRRTDPR